MKRPTPCRLGHTSDFVTLKNRGDVFGHLLVGTTSFSGGELKRSAVAPLLGHVEQQLFMEVRKGPPLPPIYRSRPLSFSTMKSMNNRPRIGNWRPKACNT